MSGHRTPHGALPGPGGGLGFGLLTVSDTRRADDDLSGRAMRELVGASCHRVHRTAIVPDDPEIVRDHVLAWSLEAGCEAIVSSGGTGLSPRDQTVDAVAGLFDVRIDGFGELFRHLSFEQIGPAAMLSRAAAGVVRGTPVFLLPGSPKAVTLAFEKLILPTIAHVVAELRRDGPAT